jgi:hypothetical protein
LSELGEAFPNFLRGRGESNEENSKIEIVCFHEEYGSRIGVVSRAAQLSLRHLLTCEQIVTKESASLSGYEPLSIPADHEDICKFTSKGDAGYQRVSDTLLRWINIVSKPAKQTTQQVRASPSYTMFSR